MRRWWRSPTATRYNTAAESFTDTMIWLEAEIDDLEALHEQSSPAVASSACGQYHEVVAVHDLGGQPFGKQRGALADHRR